MCICTCADVSDFKYSGVKIFLLKLGSELKYLVEKFQSAIKMQRKYRPNFDEVENFHEVECTPNRRSSFKVNCYLRKIIWIYSNTYNSVNRSEKLKKDGSYHFKWNNYREMVLYSYENLHYVFKWMLEYLKVIVDVIVCFWLVKLRVIIALLAFIWFWGLTEEINTEENLGSKLLNICAKIMAFSYHLFLRKNSKLLKNACHLMQICAAVNCCTFCSNCLFAYNLNGNQCLNLIGRS